MKLSSAIKVSDFGVHLQEIFKNSASVQNDEIFKLFIQCRIHSIGLRDIHYIIVATIGKIKYGTASNYEFIYDKLEFAPMAVSDHDSKRA